jgi:putative transposase
MVTPLSALTEQERAQAMARFNVLQPFLEDEVELRQLAQQQQLALRTLRRWVQRYTTEGLAGLVRQRRPTVGDVGVSPLSCTSVSKASPSRPRR